jgi:hypothetical protein
MSSHWWTRSWPNLLAKPWVALNGETSADAAVQRCVSLSLNWIIGTLGLRFRILPLSVCDIYRSHPPSKKYLGTEVQC